MPPVMTTAVSHNMTTSTMSVEQYLIHQAKLALKLGDPYASKAWMITAHTMFPENFSVQFEVYEIEKTAGNVEECARCLSTLFQSFPNEKILWNEINMIITALRSDSLTPELEFYNDIFLCISENTQRQILMKSAERTKDPMEHCRLLLLVLSKFPRTMTQVAPTLIETLQRSERTYFPDTVVANCYREMLVCEVMPIVILHKLLLPHELALPLLQKSMEYILHFTFRRDQCIMSPEKKLKNPWSLLFDIHAHLTSLKGWTLKINFRDPPLAVLKTIQQFSSKATCSANAESYVKQLVYGTTVYLCYFLYVYTSNMEPAGSSNDSGHAGTQLPLVLVEAFIETSPLKDEPPSKRHRKMDHPVEPILSVASDEANFLVELFQVGLQLSRLSKTNILEKEFALLSEAIKLSTWSSSFSLDSALYSEDMELVHSRLKARDKGILTHLMFASAYHYLRNKTMCIESVLSVIKSIDSLRSGGELTDNLTAFRPTTTARIRHLHFLPLARIPVLQYCVRLLFNALKDAILHITSLANLDILMGHLMVLSQLDWPAERPLIASLCARIKEKGSFSYDLFSQYLIQIDILEEFMYMATHGDLNPRLELSKPTTQQLLSQRRVTTRNVDKGAKEDLKMTIKRQVARSDEPIDALIIQFLTTENIQQVL